MTTGGSNLHVSVFLLKEKRWQDLDSAGHTCNSLAVLAAVMAEGLDEWADADMESVIQYLRGGKKLQLPPNIRALLRLNH